jgi:hypothetical protein
VLLLAAGTLRRAPGRLPSRARPGCLTAASLATGATVYEQLAGTGLGFNSNYAPVSIGPDGSAYVGVLGGLVSVRDG